MLEVSNKRTVTTRKEHECYGCAEKIGKGETSIYVRGKEDDQHINFHLHPNCHIVAMKQNLYQEGFPKGAIKHEKQTTEDFSVANTTYPF